MALAEDGTLRLIQANPDRFELIDEREVAATTTWGHLAMAGDQLFVRELEALSVFQYPAPAARAVAARGRDEAAPRPGSGRCGAPVRELGSAATTPPHESGAPETIQ